MVTAIRAQRLIDCTGAAPIEGAVLLVDGDRIAAVGPASQIPIPEGAETIDLGGQTLLPGFVDAHTHVSLIPGLGGQSAQKRQPFPNQLFCSIGNVRKMLRSGVTTARVMGEEYFLDVELRRAIDAGQVPGPRLIITTRSITATNSHGAALTYSDGVDEVRKTARENLKAGATSTIR